jgi:hypothetical protein
MRPKIKLRYCGSTDSKAGSLAARGEWIALPAAPSLHDIACIVDTFDGYDLAEEYVGRQPADVARSLIDRYRVSGMWSGTTVELLAALFGAVRAWRGSQYGPSDDDHRRALGMFGALRERLKEFPDEVEFIPARKMNANALRTSASHPLVIGWVQAPPGWKIGITIAPGKTSVSNQGFRWARVLGEDLDHLVAQRVGTLVCLLEAHEMARLGIPDLAAAAGHRGIDLIHAPIEDVRVPSVEDANVLIAQLLRKKEDPIVIHCNGGLG